jgi:Bacterial regulatory protein, Fis family
MDRVGGLFQRILGNQLAALKSLEKGVVEFSRHAGAFCQPLIKTGAYRVVNLPAPQAVESNGFDHIPAETMDALVRYRWPGNVRELQNLVERAVILSPHTVLRVPTRELEQFSGRKGSNMPITGLDEVKRDHILRALEESNWVVGGRNGAAGRLGMKRTSLVYRMHKLRISRPVPSARNGGAESFARGALIE